VAVYQHFTEGLTEEVLNTGLADGDFDFVDAVAQEVPIRVPARIMGLPGADLDTFIDLGDRLIANTDLAGMPRRIRSNFTNGLRELPVRLRPA
jgi:cytochrome P450